MNKIKEELKKDWVILFLILVTLLAGIYLYPALPERVPSHWNIQGEIDGYSSRTFGAIGLPLINLGLYFMLIILPALDPKKKNYKGFESYYRSMRLFFHIFFAWLYIITIYAALGNHIEVDVITKGSIAVLFLLLGNMMGKFKPNYFVGLRTPWTLASDDVWRKTHRFGGKVWVAGSIVMLAAAFIKGTIGFVIFFTVLMFLVLIPTVYSYLKYKKDNIGDIYK